MGEEDKEIRMSFHGSHSKQEEERVSQSGRAGDLRGHIEEWSGFCRHSLSVGPISTVIQ